jgi:6-phosphogluconolactonase
LTADEAVATLAIMNQLFIATLVAAIVVSIGSSACLADAAQAKPTKLRVYVGTYTGPKSKGIYLYDFDTATGAMRQVGVAAKTSNPSFLAMSPDHKHLYAVGEVSEFQGKKSGAVSAFSVDGATGMLTLLNAQATGGEGPCHVSLDSKGKFVFAANYGSGTVVSLPLESDGKLGEPASVIHHEGKGTDPKRQAGPHAHGIWPSPDDRFVLACDLGLDQVIVYKLDATTGKLTRNDLPPGVVPPAAGARHAAFSLDHKFLYVINEMANTMTTFAWDAKTGSLAATQTLSTLPEGFSGTSHTAEVVMHPTGKFLYGSNRGHDSLALFTIEPTSGKLTFVNTTPVGGKNPRNFNIDPTGQWLIAAHQSSDTLAVFSIDQTSGALKQVGETIPAPAPACVIFAPAK